MTHPSRGRKFLGNLSYSITGQVVTLAAGIVTSIILARWLGPDLRGELALVLLLPSTLLALLTSGFNAPIVHFVATGEWPNQRITANVTGIGTLLAALSIAVGCAAIHWRHLLFPGISTPLLIASLGLIPIQVAQGSLNAILIGKQAFRRSMLTNLIVSPLQLVINLTAVVYLDLGILGAFASTLLCGLVGTSISATHVYREVGVGNFWTWPELSIAPLRSAITYGMKAHVANLAGFLNYRVDMFLVNLLLGTAQAGFYVVAVGLAEKLWILVSSLAGVVFPTVSAEAQSDPLASAQFTSRIAATMLCLLSLAAIVMSLTAIPFINLMYGAEFAKAGWVMISLLPGITLLGHAKLLSNHIAGIGHPEVNAIGASLGVVINIASNFALIPRYGLIGAGISTSVSYSIISFYCYYKFVQLTGVSYRLPLIPNGRDLKLAAAKSTALARRVRPWQ
ncbi:oligosaccharide flippase family protein [Rhodopirellula sp. P2]|uniref:oligosaccharide flippase family protein n=1 Tax=Rhodopirellula sp. P2 TaxID=2127060 RepID=UPI0023682509|nr:oligosaccharide flippase family protein [Rhodopirellula sp. P2]WDQ15652.1 polysaccharide biosynthesis C-terminal domain-containing protein [Rhodopirellula sp. P2]